MSSRAGSSESSFPGKGGLHNKAGKDQGTGFPRLAAGHCSVVITEANGLQHTDKCPLVHLVAVKKSPDKVMSPEGSDSQGFAHKASQEEGGTSLGITG